MAGRSTIEHPRDIGTMAARLAERTSNLEATPPERRRRDRGSLLISDIRAAIHVARAAETEQLEAMLTRATAAYAEALVR